MAADKRPSNSIESPLWSRTTKSIVAIITLLLLALLARRFQSLIGQFVAAAILAYLLNPLVTLIDRRSKLRRNHALVIIYLLLAIGVIWAIIALGVAAFQQVSTLLNLTPELISDVSASVQELTIRTDPITLGAFRLDPRTIPWDTITNQILGLAEPLLSQSTQIVRQIAATSIRWVGMMFFVFIISIYFANEIPRLGSYISAVAQQPGYRQDAERLMRDFGRIWSAYLRGQVILGLVIFLVVWLGLTVLGVQNALALGLLAGLLEFIPNLGPVISAAVAIVVASFQPTNYLGVSSFQYALLVLGLMIVIQQLENTILVPRIIGESLDLHPLLVIVGVFMGGSLAGILGAVLAAPVLATLKLVGVYAWRKMFDLDPFPHPEEEKSAPRPLLSRAGKLIKRGKRPSD